MKINNVVIENQSPEFAVELKKFWDVVEIKETRYNRMPYEKYQFHVTEIYYGIIDGKFGTYHKHEIPEGVQIFDHIPTLAELGLEEITFPCEMEVYGQDGDKVGNRIVVAKFNDQGKDYYIARSIKSVTGFSIFYDAKPIRTEQLTLTELLTIASEVKGVQVTLKEEKP